MSRRSIAAVRLVAHDATRLSRFYNDAFGFVAAASPPVDPASEARLLGLSGEVRRHRVRLREQTLELLTMTHAGAPVPVTGGPDTIFQHIALIVPDMGAALARLERAGGATPISQGGPQTLPASSGGVTAYKFRDPEGHPLELLQFPPGATPPAWSHGEEACLGYDHSAVIVTDLEASLRFYAELGLVRTGGSLNEGPGQARLDGVSNPVVDVVALSLDAAPPHLELLHYRGSAARTPTSSNDIAATQLVLTGNDPHALRTIAVTMAAHVVGPGIVDCGDGPALLLRDPDGHRILLRASSL